MFRILPFLDYRIFKNLHNVSNSKQGEFESVENDSEPAEQVESDSQPYKNLTQPNPYSNLYELNPKLREYISQSIRESINRKAEYFKSKKANLIGWSNDENTYNEHVMTNPFLYYIIIPVLGLSFLAGYRFHCLLNRVYNS